MNTVGATAGAVRMKLPGTNFFFSLRARVLLLILSLLIFPFLTYRMALEFNRKLLEQQIIQQSQTVQNLALILENRPDLWSLQIHQAAPIRALRYLDLEESSLWIVNNRGITTYVVGALPPPMKEVEYEADPFAWFGKQTIKLIHSLFPSTLPFLMPYDPEPEYSLVHQALTGATAQRFRFDSQHQPISLMSATPIFINGRIVGALVLEQRIDTLFGYTLKDFYHIIGIGTLLILALIFIFSLYALHISRRILRLEEDVMLAFDRFRLRLQSFQDSRVPLWRRDELEQLRHQIFIILSQLKHYEQFLKQLPRALRHELHNPLNRLNLSLQRIQQTGQIMPYLEHARHGLDQLEHIVRALSEASSIEHSIQQEIPMPYPVGEMLQAFAQALHTQYGDRLQTDIHLPDDITACGDGFLLEQALDKLLGNAFDFSPPDRPVRLRAWQEEDEIVIEVRNVGQLPHDMRPEQLFSGMVSVRMTASDSTPHLGLGLYIVKLIAEFHKGEVFAHQNGQEVVFGMKLPQAEKIGC